jgi:hypothetical protein
MLASQFVSKLIISVGATGAFFTLRETCLYGRTISSFHHFNLAQDPDVAYEKALTYAHNNGMQLVTSRDDMIAEMREIQRATSEQLAERKAKIERAEAEQAAYIQKAHDEKIEMIEQGLYPFGQYHNQPFANAAISYLQWLINSKFDHTDDVITLLQQRVTEQCKHLLPDVDATVGTVGKRETFNVKIERCLQLNGYYGVTYITLMVNVDNNAVMVSKGAFAADVDDCLTIKATVKEHSRYRGQMQTIVQRVTVLS